MHGSRGTELSFRGEGECRGGGRGWAGLLLISINPPSWSFSDDLWTVATDVGCDFKVMTINRAIITCNSTLPILNDKV